MIIEITKIVTTISDDEVTNAQNYMESLEYISNLYNFLNKLKLVVPLDQVNFLPSFKGKYVVEKLGLMSVDKENEMKLFIVQSSLFLEDTTILSLQKELSTTCEQIERTSDILKFYLP
jgi:hypothetical protein